MNPSKRERLLSAHTTYDLLSVTAPGVARHVRLLTLALLPPAERERVLGTRCGPVRLARAFLDTQGDSPEARALNAYRAMYDEG